jgi:uncharacterized membrane protein
MVTFLLVAIIVILLLGATAVRSALATLAGLIVFVVLLAYLGFQSGVDPLWILVGFCGLVLAGGLIWRIADPEGFKRFEKQRLEEQRKKSASKSKRGDV